MLKDEGSSILGDPASLAPGRHVTGAEPLRQKRSSARKRDFVTGRFEAANDAGVVYACHHSHAADGDAEGAIALELELGGVKFGLLLGLTLDVRQGSSW